LSPFEKRGRDFPSVSIGTGSEIPDSFLDTGYIKTHHTHTGMPKVP